MRRVTPIPFPARLRPLAFLLGLAGAGAIAACHKSAPEIAEEGVPTSAAIKQSLYGLDSKRVAQEKAFSALRKRVEALPPDLPGFRASRARFYAIEEGRGVMNAQVTLLASRFERESSAGNHEGLRQISREIVGTNDDLLRVDQLYVALLHQMMAFERMALREKATSIETATASRTPP